MATSELSVAIKGTDTLSPALRAVNEQLNRSRIQLTATGAIADTYRQKITAVQTAYALGQIDAIKYDRELARLERQFRQTAEAATAFNTVSGTGVGVTNQFVSNADRMARGAQRAAFGIQTMSMAFQGGRVNAQGFISAMGMMGIGSPWFLAISAGLSVIGTLILQVGERSQQTADEIESSTDRIRSAIGGLDNRARLEGIVQRLERKQRGEELLLGSGIFTGGGLSPQEAAELAAARTTLAGMRRERDQRTRSGDPIRDMLSNLGDRPGKPTDMKEDEGLGAFLAGSDKFGPLRDELKGLKDDLKETEDAAISFGNAFVSGFEGALNAAMTGGNVMRAITTGVLTELSREAKVKALYEAAEGFASLFNPAKGGPAGAATHFKAAALYGAVAIGAGIAAGGGGGGGGGGGRTSTGPMGMAGTGERAQNVSIIQIVVQSTGEVVRQFRVDDARLTARGGSVPGVSSSVTRVPVEGLALITRGFR